ncbi:MAG: GNAT family N-acetyltransferase [Chloroflexi bacterium]|nr:GNAT family N-acetyltransferase [Chloroflexota bacterium]
MSKTVFRRVDITNLDSRDYEAINHVVNNSKNSSVFHTVEWNSLLIRRFRLPHITLLACVNGAVTGIYTFHRLQGGTYNSPAIHLQSAYGGPISLEDDPDTLMQLLQEAERVAPIAYFQLWTPPLVQELPVEQIGYAVEEMYTPIMRLDGSEEERFSRLHKDKRYKIRRAQKLGVTVEEAQKEDLPTYHNLVAETLIPAGVTPVPLDFLQAVLTELGPLGKARFFLAKFEQNVVSGTIILYHRDTAYGWDIGWRREFANLSPNDLLTWEVTERACKDGCKNFDLLRIEPDRLPGIAKWKATFGGDIVKCYLLRKATKGYRLIHPLKVLLTNPARVVRKIRSVFVRSAQS